MSGGREYHCPSCGDQGVYPPGAPVPARVAMLRTEEGRAQLRQDARAEAARNLPENCTPRPHPPTTAPHPDARSWPKCYIDEVNPTDAMPNPQSLRITNGAATDVRAWWPACTQHTYGDTAVSPDAARYVPGGAP
jgi:hypothetical protein